MGARIVLTNYRETYKKISSSLSSSQCARLIQAIEDSEKGRMTQVSDYSGTVTVRSSTDIVEGTVIATLLDGKYPNESHGNHVAIFVKKLENGIRVFDQYVGKPPGNRDIRYKGAKHARRDRTMPDGTVKKNVLDMSNDGDFYYIVEGL